MVLFLLLACSAGPVPDSPPADAIARLTEHGACGDLLVWARSPEGDAELVITLPETPIAATQAGGAGVYVEPMNQAALVDVSLRVGTGALPDPCVSTEVPTDARVFEGVDGRVLLSVDVGPPVLVDVSIQDGVLIDTAPDGSAIAVPELDLAGITVP
jgi:hypothetical protein